MVKAQRNKTNIRHFPLIEQANLAEKDLFNAHQGYTIPEYINANLLHTLRHYQDEAIRNYHYTQTQINPKAETSSSHNLSG